jgi:hypothetical protein
MSSSIIREQIMVALETALQVALPGILVEHNRDRPAEADRKR